MKKVTYTDKYSGKTFTEVKDVTEEDLKALRAKAERKATKKLKLKKVKEEYLKAHRNRT